MKVLAVHGLHFGFHGVQEHTNHRVDYLLEGTFEADHECVCLPFMHVANMPVKMHKLSLNNTILCADKSLCLCISIFMEQSESIGMVLHRFKATLAPSQQCMYCKVARNTQRKHFASLGISNDLYSPNEPLGKTQL